MLIIPSPPNMRVKFEINIRALDMIHFTRYLAEVARKRRNKIAVGLYSLAEERTAEIIWGVSEAVNSGYADVTLVSSAKEPVETNVDNIEVLYDDSPERKMVNLLASGEVAGIVRGTIPSSKFLGEVKRYFKLDKIFRLALLETAYGQQFFLAPVGIDEGNTPSEKIKFVVNGSSLLERMRVKPSVAVLSGGRKDDLGRDPAVDTSLKDAELVVETVKESNPNLEIRHFEILIEDAVKAGANLILAPNGIAGNYIYRTLLHLGKGKSYGAIYLGLDKVVLDTSRAAPPEEYRNAVMLASGISGIM